MPEQHVVADLLVECLLLSRTYDLIDLPNLHLRVARFGVVKILLDELVLRRGLIHCRYRAAEFSIVLVEHRCVLLSLLIEQLSGDLKIRDSLQHSYLAFHFLVIVQDEVRHVLVPKVMWYKRVKLA